MSKDASHRILRVLVGQFAFLVPIAYLGVAPEHFILFKQTLSELLVGAICAALAFMIATGKINLRISTGHISALIFVVVCALSLAGRRNIYDGVAPLILALDWFIVALAGSYALRDRESTLEFCGWSSMGLLVVGAAGALERFTGESLFINSDLWDGRIASSYGAAPLYAGYLIAALCFSRLGAAQSGGWKKYFHIAAWALGAANLAFTGTLAAWICYAAVEAFLLFSTASPAARKRMSAAFFPACAAVVVCALVFVPSYRIHRFKANKAQSAAMRINKWNTTALMIKDNLWRGVGVGQFDTEYPRYGRLRGENMDSIDEMTNPENLILFAIAETGIPGLAALCGMFALLFVPGAGRGGAEERETRGCLRGGAVGILLYSMLHYPLHTPGVWPLFFVAAGGLWALAPGGMKAADSRHARLAAAVCVFAAGFVIAAQSTIYLKKETLIKYSIDCYEEKDAACALKHSGAAMRLTVGKDWRSLKARCLALIAAGRFEEAYGVYDRLALLRPWDSNLRHIILEALKAGPGQFSKRLEILEELRRMDPGNPRPLVLEALLYRDNGDYIMAAGKINERIALKTPAGWADYYFLFTCMTNMETRDGNEEARVLAKAVNLHPDKPEPYYQMGVAYEQIKSFEQARRMYRQALAVDGAHKPSRLALEKIMSTRQ